MSTLADGCPSQCRTGLPRRVVTDGLCRTVLPPRRGTCLVEAARGTCLVVAGTRSLTMLSGSAPGPTLSDPAWTQGVRTLSALADGCPSQCGTGLPRGVVTDSLGRTVLPPRREACQLAEGG